MEDLKSMLVRHEGVRLKPYQDTVGKLTIGVGRNLEDVGISWDEALILLDNDIKRATASASNAFSFFSSLSPVRKNVILDMTFNMGIQSLKGFTGMLSAIESGDFEKAATEMLDSKWAKQVGVRATELSAMMRAG